MKVQFVGLMVMISTLGFSQVASAECKTGDKACKAQKQVAQPQVKKVQAETQVVAPSGAPAPATAESGSGDVTYNFGDDKLQGDGLSANLNNITALDPNRFKHDCVWNVEDGGWDKEPQDKKSQDKKNKDGNTSSTMQSPLRACPGYAPAPKTPVPGQKTYGRDGAVLQPSPSKSKTVIAEGTDSGSGSVPSKSTSAL